MKKIMKIVSLSIIRAVPAPSGINWPKDMQPVNPKEVEKVMNTVDSAIVEWENIQSRRGDISVTTPMTNMSLPRGENGNV